ncbi:hypothetical protein ABMB68_009742 [Bradyrhizobium sp. RT4a]
MTRRRLIIGGGFRGTMSASAAAKAGALSELIVTEHALGPVGAPRFSAGLHLRKDPSSSLTRSCAVALVVMAGSAVSGGFRPVAVCVEAGPGEISNDRDQFKFKEPQDPGRPRIRSQPPNFCAQYPFLEQRWNSCRGCGRPDRPARMGPCRKDSRGARLALRQAARKVAYRVAASSIACLAVSPCRRTGSTDLYGPGRSLQ